MKTLLMTTFAASAFLASPIAFADSHGSHDHHATAPDPTQEECRAMHDNMMALHEDSTDENDGNMPEMSTEDHERMMACHAIMEDMHAAHGEDDTSGHGEMHHDGEHDAHQGDQDMDADDETPSHDHD